MSAPAAVPQFVGAGSAAEQSVEDRWYMREHGSPAPVDSSPFGWFIRMLHFHPLGGVRNRLSGSILSLRRIVGGRSPHPPKAAAGIPLRPPRVRPQASALDASGARQETAPQGPRPFRQG